MAVKDEIGRSRYVGFEVPEPRPSRRALSGELASPGWKLTVYTDEVGILRVPHTEVDEAIERLTGIGARTRTTSGTIKAAKRRMGVLDA